MSSAVLGLDTSGSWCSAALLRGADLFTRRAEVGNAHSDHLLGMIEGVLADAAVTLPDCTTIAFSAGPGSFTGLRIACAAAQGLAFGAGLPVAAIGTLEAIARSAMAGQDAQPAEILVAQDARMGEVYWAVLVPEGDGWRTRIGPSLATPTRLREILSREACDPIDLGCGNAWASHGDAMAGLVARVVHRASADAADVAWLGRLAWQHDRLVPPDRAAPIYVRDDVAMTSAQRDERARALAGGR